MLELDATGPLGVVRSAGKHRHRSFEVFDHGPFAGYRAAASVPRVLLRRPMVLAMEVVAHDDDPQIGGRHARLTAAGVKSASPVCRQFWRSRPGQAEDGSGKRLLMFVIHSCVNFIYITVLQGPEGNKT